VRRHKVHKSLQNTGSFVAVNWRRGDTQWLLLHHHRHGTAPLPEIGILYVVYINYVLAVSIRCTRR
jgi:hypothetical protein